MSKNKRSRSRGGRKANVRREANRNGAEDGSNRAQGTHESAQPDAPLPEQVDLLEEISAMVKGESDEREIAVPAPSEAPGLGPPGDLVPLHTEEPDVGPIHSDSVGSPRSALAEALLQIGELEERGAYELSLERLVTLQADQPDSAVVLARMGSVLGSLGRFGEAEAALERANRMSPDDVDIRAGMGIVEFKRGLCDQAEATLRWVCERQADHGPAHLYRGEALNLLGRIDEALASLERASELDPDNPRIYQTLGVIYDKRREPDEAARMYKRARELERR